MSELNGSIDLPDKLDRIAVLCAYRVALEASGHADQLRSVHSIMLGVLVGNAIGMLGGKFGLLDTGIFACSILLLSWSVEMKLRAARKEASKCAMELLETIAPAPATQKPPIPAGRVEHLN